MAEIVRCPSCGKQLQVPEDFFGKSVQCPECKGTFRAEPASSAGGVSANAPPAPPPSVPAWEKPPSRAREEHEEEKRPRRRREEEDDDDRPRRRRLAPHRGGMILAFGIMSLFIMPIVFGPLAWIMGNADLREMRDGRMDPSGESQTNTGRILGMVAVILQAVLLVVGCLFFVLFMMLGFMGAAAHHHR